MSCKIAGSETVFYSAKTEESFFGGQKVYTPLKSNMSPKKGLFQ